MPPRRAAAQKTRAPKDEDMEDEDMEEEEEEEAPSSDEDEEEEEASKGAKKKRTEKEKKKKTLDAPHKTESATKDEDDHPGPPQKKTKLLKACPADARGRIQFLLQTNARPFGIQQLVEQLQMDKGVAMAMVDQLERQGVAKAKTIGNQKVVWFADAGRGASIDDVTQMKEELATTMTTAKRIEGACLVTEKRAAAKAKEPTNDALEEQLRKEESEVTALEAKVGAVGTRGIVTKAHMTKALKEYNNMLKTWVGRKRACKEVVETVADAMEEKPKQFIQDVAESEEYELDEDCGVALPPPKPIRI